MIIAHRGESYIAPENSLAAINLAWKNGVGAVEIDVHLSLDGEIVVIHDSHTGRTGDAKHIIAKSSLKKIKSVDIGKKKADKYAGENIPTLREVIKTIPADGKLIIELKCGEEILFTLSEVLKKSGLKDDQLEIISFDLKTLSLAKKFMPRYKMLWLLDLDYYWPHWLLRINRSKIIEKLKANNINGVNAWSGKSLNKNFVDFFKKEGFLVYTWTVNDVSNAQSLFAMGVDGITTDRAAWLKDQLEK